MSHQIGFRRLRLERCEPRRVLSADALVFDGFVADLSFDPSYLLAASNGYASNGYTSIDADSSLVTLADTTYQRGETDAVVRLSFDSGTLNAHVVSFADSLKSAVEEASTFLALHDYTPAKGSVTVTPDDLKDFGLSDWYEPDTTVGPDYTPPSRPETTVPLVVPTPPEATVESTPVTEPADGDPGESSEPSMEYFDRRAPLQSITRIERVSPSTPPAGLDQAGAGLIDLAQLLDSSATAEASLVAASPAVVEVPDLVARDAALAVESWVRAAPAASEIRLESVPEEPLRVEEADTAKPLDEPRPTLDGRRQTTASVGQSLQPEPAATADLSHKAEEDRSIEVAAPGLIDRSGAYRLAMAAFSTLLGGGLVWVARRDGDERACVEHPRRRGKA